MKKMILTIVAMLTMTLATNAMSYEQARNQALFLTDKMAYELNLTDAQYEAAYEINLDYLMGVTSYDDVYGTYWERRNLDLSYILLEWQWNAFRAATYFYRPLYWSGGYWHFGIYARYPRRDYFYFGRPVFYASYRGGHSWHSNGGRSYYYGRRGHYNHHSGGMRDGWDRGDYRGGGSDRFGSRNSSTRTTVNNNFNNGGNRSANSISSLGNARSSGSFGGRTSSGSFGNPINPGNSNIQQNSSGNSTPNARSAGSFGARRSSISSDVSTMRSNTNVRNNTYSGSSFMRPSTSVMRSSGSFGGRSSGSFSGGSTVTRSSSGSFGGGNSSGGGAHSGGSFGRR